MSDALRFKLMSNENFVKHVMSFSVHGALTQVFIIEAIRFYCKRVIETEVDDSKVTPIDPRVWKEVAEEVLGKFKLKYEDLN